MKRIIHAIDKLFDKSPFLFFIAVVFSVILLSLPFLLIFRTNFLTRITDTIFHNQNTTVSSTATSQTTADSKLKSTHAPLQTESESLYVKIDDSKNFTEDYVLLEKEDVTNYTLYLPTRSSLSDLVVYSTCTESVKINNQNITNGSVISKLNIGTNSLEIGNNTYSLTVYQSKNIPSVFINLSGGSLRDIAADINYECGGSISFLSSDGDISGTSLSSMSGRGNSTWRIASIYNKYPFNIKLEEKMDVLGLGTDKKWCLIANSLDESLIHNLLMNNLSKATKLTYTPNSENVNLYLEGKYLGVYQLTQDMDVGNNSLVQINDLEKQTEDLNQSDLSSYPKISSGNGGRFSSSNSYQCYEIPNNPDDITGGYLIECELTERYNEAKSGFITSRGQPVKLKSPTYVSKAQLFFIRDYFQRVEDAVYSESGINSEGENYKDLIDITSFAKVYLLNEFSMNVDAGATSFYMYKDIDDKLCAGPIWDYDWALGSYQSRDGVDLSSGYGWYVKNKSINGRGQSRDLALLAQLCTHEEFWMEVKRIWNDSFKANASSLLDSTTTNKAVPSIDSMYQFLAPAATLNYIKNPYLASRPQWGSTDTGSTYEANIDFLKSFVQNRIQFLSELDD